MINGNTPSRLRHLIPLVEKWGIEDDSYRDNLVYNAPTEELRNLVNSITDKEADILNEWFCDPRMVKSPSEEYLKYSAFFMAYEYAKSRLEKLEDESI